MPAITRLGFGGGSSQFQPQAHGGKIFVSGKQRSNLTPSSEEYGRFLRQTIIHLCPKDMGLQFNDIEQEARLKLWRALQSEKEIHDPCALSL